MSTAAESVARRSLRSTWLAQPGVTVALAVLGTIAFLALFAPWLGMAAPEALTDLVAQRNAAPSWSHPFGTDPLSRDVFARVWFGARHSLSVAIGATGGALLLAGVLGLASGVMPQRLDRWVQRLEDALLAIPRVLLLLVLVATWGPLGAPSLSLALALTGWMRPARLIREEVRTLVVHEWFVAARALGSPPWHLARRHLFPSLAPLFGVLASSGIAQALLLETGLSYLGLGVAPPAASWGTVLQELADVMGQARWLVVPPGVVVTATVVALFRLGDTLQTALEQHERRHVS